MQRKSRLSLIASNSSQNILANHYSRVLQQWLAIAKWKNYQIKVITNQIKQSNRRVLLVKYFSRVKEEFGSICVLKKVTQLYQDEIRRRTLLAFRHYLRIVQKLREISAKSEKMCQKYYGTLEKAKAIQFKREIQPPIKLR